MPDELHKNPFIEIEDMLLTEGASNSRENITPLCSYKDG